MTTVNGLPAHVLLVHAIVVLLPLSALLLMLTAVWAPARRRLAGPNAILSVVVVALVPITTSAGEWLEHRVASTALVRAHTELGDTALVVAIGVGVMALVVWWRGRELSYPAEPAAGAAPVLDESGNTQVGTATLTRSATGRRTFLAPASMAATVVIAVLSIVAGGVAVYDVYRIGDSGAKASWDGKVASGPANR
ncbi:hypothetical protein OHA70_33935 [Kribbella sp. NBC_00382]|uniref:hypothetical protein n=1 Tax=Kribbella sp. NBC_00382 TaxID=2975967 RepID=UPI002E1A54A3